MRVTQDLPGGLETMFLAGVSGHVYVYLPPAWAIDKASVPFQNQGRGLYALELVFDSPDEGWEVTAHRE